LKIEKEPQPEELLARPFLRALKASTTAGATTIYDYWPHGQLKAVTLPDASAVNYGYDEAQRLTSVTDSLGNSITYTLDNAGNRTAETVKDDFFAPQPRPRLKKTPATTRMGAWTKLLIGWSLVTLPQTERQPPKPLTTGTAGAPAMGTCGGEDSPQLAHAGVTQITHRLV